MIPYPIERALKKIGSNISLARRARGWSQEDFAQRLDVSISTVRRLESGFHGAALHTFLRALHLLGLLEQIVQLTSIENDSLGAALLQEQLPKHIHSKRSDASNQPYAVQDDFAESDELEGF